MLKTNNSFPSKINENLSTTKTLLHQKTVIYDLNTKTIPWQRMPLPKYPSRQVQLYEPRVLVHFAFSWHSLRSEVWHSSKSVSCRKATPDQKQKGYVKHTLSKLVKTFSLEWCFAILDLSAPRDSLVKENKLWLASTRFSAFFASNSCVFYEFCLVLWIARVLCNWPGWLHLFLFYHWTALYILFP